MDSITNRLLITPLLCTACGTALGFYFLFHTTFIVKVIVFSLLLTALCFFRVLALMDSQQRKIQLINVCYTVFIVGLFIGVSFANVSRNEVNFGIPENNVTGVEGILLEDPRIISGGRAMVLLSLNRVAGSTGLRVSGSGEITLFFTQDNADRLKEFGRGTTIFAEGSLRTGTTSGQTRITRQSWTFNAHSLHVTKSAPAIERMRTGIRLGLIDRFDEDGWGGLALALLLGIRDNLDSNLTTLYREAGLSYILALSGMHLAILAALITFFLKKPLGLKVSAIVGAVLIILYCLLVGPMPSLNRAALMYVLGVLAILGALPRKVMSILALSFLIQIIVTPAAGNSISFILSYLAMLGILITGKAMSDLLAGKIPLFVLQPLAISCGAFLATAGVVGFTFGIIAPIGIITSLIIVPLTAIFMVGSIIWLVLDLVRLSFLLSTPLSLLYKLMENVASLARIMPRISVNFLVVFVLSVALSVLIVALEYRRRKKLVKLKPFL